MIQVQGKQAVKNVPGEFKTKSVEATRNWPAAHQKIQMAATGGSMGAIIRNVITFYEMRAEALSVLVANSQKALRESELDKKRKADEQAEKLENFVKDLSIDVNNMLTRFWFQKEHKQRKNEPMTDDETRALADFVSFVKTLTKSVRSLLRRFQKGSGRPFEEKLDKEIEEIETDVKRRLKEFDEVLEETLTEESGTLKKRLSEYVGNMVGGAAKAFKGSIFGAAKLKRAGKSITDRLTKAG